MGSNLFYIKYFSQTIHLIFFFGPMGRQDDGEAKLFFSFIYLTSKGVMSQGDQLQLL